MYAFWQIHFFGRHPWLIVSFHIEFLDFCITCPINWFLFRLCVCCELFYLLCFSWFVWQFPNPILPPCFVGPYFISLILISSGAKMNLFKTIRIWVLLMKMRYKFLLIPSACFSTNWFFFFLNCKLKCINYFLLACKSSHRVETSHTSKSYQRCGEIITSQNWAYPSGWNVSSSETVSAILGSEIFFFWENDVLVSSLS